MVATQSFSISRRALDVEDYIDIGRRHVGWIVGPTFFGIVASICYAFTQPNEYVSKATMQIAPAQVSENMVQSTISNSLNERIQQMETQITSRTELSAIINDPRLLLYKDELKTKPLDDVIEEMRSAIGISFVSLPGAMGRRATAFDITFRYNDRYKAQQTVTALMNKFEELNDTTQKTGQDAVKGLVSDLLQKAKADLADANDKLTAFKEGNAGKLPEQVQSNIAREANYTAKMQSDNDAIFRDQQALAGLQNQRDQAKGRLDYYEEQQAAILSLSMTPGGLPASQESQDLAQMNKFIDSAEFNLQQLRRQFNDSYPQVRSAQRQLDGYKAKRDDMAAKLQAKMAADAQKAAENANKPDKAAKTAADLKEAQVRNEVDQQLKTISVTEKMYKDDISRLEAEIAIYKKDSEELSQMLKESNGIEAQYEEFRQAKELAQAQYVDLERKEQAADASGQLIQRKVGEILDVLDTPNVPQVPTNPNRPKIIGVGFALSIILGLGMAGLQEMKDTSLKNLKDVRAYTNLPVLCSIPLLENTMLVKRKRRLTYLAWAAAIILGAAAVSGAVLYYFQVTNKT